MSNVVKFRSKEQSFHEVSIPESPTISEIAGCIHALSQLRGDWPDTHTDVAVSTKLLTVIAWATKASQDAQLSIQQESFQLAKMAIGQMVTELFDVAVSLGIDIEMELIAAHERRMGAMPLTRAGTIPIASSE